ncbi:uncharacterized protein LOC6554031 [Drosophila erecta]|uniref:GG16019 n=1 Tax=Drosophila erecta TaxID=7220 RepID=B3P0C5_DROER|nr:uncharacterized protein LOC6554031 [Drosophila erecta]EDV48499.1 uncharacterized protein Dere_GG16019 [Drosophila erecta]
MNNEAYGTHLGKIKSSEPSIAPIDSGHNFDEHETLLLKPKIQEPPPSWLAWCDRNSKPVKRARPREIRKLTPWQKSGPMTIRDWKHFGAWAAFRARPKNPKLQRPAKPFCAAKYLPCALKKRQLEEDELRERMLLLAKPRKITEKYNTPDRPPAYSPAIFWGRPPHRDPGRPFQPPHVPDCFPTDELEADFWAQLRFPVRPAALLGKITPRIQSLAKPRVYPPTPHCPVPEKVLHPLDVPPPPRRKFTNRGWRMHQIRLLYLSKPVFRSDMRFFYCNV